MRVAGVELSLDETLTSVAVLTCAPELVTVERTVTSVSDDHLATLLADRGIDAVGINAPVTVTARAAGRAGDREPDGDLASVVTAHLSTRYRIRATDRWRREHLNELPMPTESAAGRRAMAGLRANRLLAGHDPTLLDPTLAVRRVVEVDPAVAMFQWRLPYCGYVAHEGRADIAEVRETIVAGLAGRLTVPAASLQVRDGGQLNAVVAGLVAVMVRLGLTERVPDEQQVHARAEGWVQLPKRDSLDNFAGRISSAA